MMKCPSYLEEEVLEVVEAVGHAFYNLDFVVDALKESGMNRVLAMSDHSGEMVRKLAGEFFESINPGADGAAAPGLKPLQRPGRAAIAPQLLEVVLEQVNDTEPPIQAQQVSQARRFIALGIEVLRVLEEKIFAALDNFLALALGPRLLRHPHLVNHLPTVGSDDVEGVVDDRGVLAVLPRRLLVRLPHVHGRRFDFRALLRANGLVKPRKTLLGAVLGNVRNRHLLQVNHRGGVMVALADGKLVNTDQPGRTLTSIGKLLLQSLLVHLLHGVNVKPELLGHAFYAPRLPTGKGHHRGQPLGVLDPPADPVEVLGDHAALWTVNSRLPEHQAGVLPGTIGHVAHATLAAVVAGAELPPATALVQGLPTLKRDHQNLLTILTHRPNHDHRKAWNIDDNIYILLLDRHLALLVLVFIAESSIQERRWRSINPHQNAQNHFCLPLVMLIILSGIAIADEITEAVKTNDINRVKYLLKENPGLVGNVDKQGLTPLHYSADMGYLDITKLLVLKGAKINARASFFYNTPLDLAAMNGH